MALNVSDGFPYYISLTKAIALPDLVRDTAGMQLFTSVSEEKSAHRYAAGKWSIRQILGHIIDHERIMTYRMLRFSRKDKTALPGYDQDLMVDNAYFDQLPYSTLLEDYQLVRRATISFMDMLQPEQITLTGMAWKFELTIDEMFRATIGHEFHHLAILKERYL